MAPMLPPPDPPLGRGGSKLPNLGFCDTWQDSNGCVPIFSGIQYSTVPTPTVLVLFFTNVSWVLCHLETKFQGQNLSFRGSGVNFWTVPTPFLFRKAPTDTLSWTSLSSGWCGNAHWISEFCYLHAMCSPRWSCFQFSASISISGATATPSDINVIAIDKVNRENMGLAVGILFLCAIETKITHTINFHLCVGFPAARLDM